MKKIYSLVSKNQPIDLSQYAKKIDIPAIPDLSRYALQQDLLSVRSMADDFEGLYNTLANETIPKEISDRFQGDSELFELFEERQPQYWQPNTTYNFRLQFIKATINGISGIFWADWDNHGFDNDIRISRATFDVLEQRCWKPVVFGYARSEDITALQNQLNDQSSALDNTRTMLGNRISTEEQARIDGENLIISDYDRADTALGARITQEIADRVSADNLKVDKSSIAIETLDYYLGTFGDQAGNTGHQFTQQRKIGTNISSSDGINFTLARGIYEVSFDVLNHSASNTFRQTNLYVDNSSVLACISGHDGTNWEGGGSLKYTVDASATNKVIKIQRTNSSGNGNCSGVMTIRRIPGTNIVTVPSGMTARRLCTLTANGGNIAVNGLSSTNLFSGTSARVKIAVPEGQEISIINDPANVITSIADAKSGAIEVALNDNATGTLDLTVIFQARTARSLFMLFNAGTWVTFGTLQFTIPASGNRAIQIRSVSGSIVCRWITWLTWDSGNDPGSMTATITPTSNQYLMSGWNFGTAGNSQQAIISDNTNSRRYRVHMMIGSSYQNNVIFVSDET